MTAEANGGRRAPAADDATIDLVVGCPVRQRSWIIERWFENLAGSVAEAGYGSGRVLTVLVGNTHLDPTFDRARRAADRLGLAVRAIHVDEPANTYGRAWTRARFAHMTLVRNELLATVREIQPDRFWSVDSDVLVAPTALSSALAGLEHFDAVGSRCYMSPSGTSFPSNGLTATTNHMNRIDARGLIEIDVIMAVKLMSPRAFSVDYVAHPLGEDVGWSIAATSAGCRLGWDGRIASKHVMTKEQLNQIDARCDF